MTLDWSVINTGLLMGVGGYLWRQSRRVDALYQALVGLDGRGGLIDTVKTLDATMTTLNTSLVLLTARFEGHEEKGSP